MLQSFMIIETGLSGSHNMKLTVMKVVYSNQKADIVQYRDYKNFSNEAFLNDTQFSQIMYNYVKAKKYTFARTKHLS